jgi:hypothetical protein
VGSAVVESSDPEKRAGHALRRGAFMLAVATAIAASAATAIFAVVFYADFLTGAAGSVARVVLSNDALTVAAATSPIFAALLVGYGYMQRGMRRRAAEKAAAAAAAHGTGPALSPDDGKQ